MIDLTARSRAAISAMVAAVSYALLELSQLHGASVLVAVWITFAATMLALAWIEIVTHGSDRRRRAIEQDSGSTAMFLLVVVGTCASLVAVLLLLGRMKNMADPRQLATHLTLSLVAVGCSWALLHTMFTFRYARLFYADHGRAGGLLFPHDREPDYLDFAYFSFVIGMTFQVSDVQVTCRRLRRLAFLHGLLSFVFNTLVVALTINIVAGLL